MKPLDTAREGFQADMRRRASKKKTEAVAARKKKPAPKKLEKISAPDLLTEIRGNSELLKKIHALVEQRGSSAGSVEFVVTERDRNGNVKSFKVLHG